MWVLAIDQGTTSSRGLVVEDGRPSNGANGSGTVPAVRRAHGEDRAAAGLWLGLSLDTTRFDMVRAVLEGVALRAAEVVAAMAGAVNGGDAGQRHGKHFDQVDGTSQFLKWRHEPSRGSFGVVRLRAGFCRGQTFGGQQGS